MGRWPVTGMRGPRMRGWPVQSPPWLGLLPTAGPAGPLTVSPAVYSLQSLLHLLRHPCVGEPSYVLSRFSCPWSWHTTLSSSHPSTQPCLWHEHQPPSWVSPQHRSLDDSAFTDIVLWPFFCSNEDVQSCGWSIFRCRQYIYLSLCI